MQVSCGIEHTGLLIEPSFSKNRERVALRGGQDIFSTDSGSHVDQSPPRKKPKQDVNVLETDTNRGGDSADNETESDLDISETEHVSSDECPNCKKSIKHSHSNNSVTENTGSDSISMSGHILEPFALEFFASLQGLPVTVEAYNVLLEHCLELQKLSSALAIYDKMKNESIMPTYETCDLLMSICESAKQWALAVQVAQDMLATGLCADERTYEWMIKMCVKLKEWDIVLDLYDEMIQSKMEPSTDARTFAIQACHGQQLWRRAIDEFNQFRKHVPAASLPFSYVIEACLDAGQSAEARKFIEEHENLQSAAIQEHGTMNGAEDSHISDSIHLPESEEERSALGKQESGLDSEEDVED
jgi:pentatricopeptide repeat protein